jgi:hypothetical protein
MTARLVFLAGTAALALAVGLAGCDESSEGDHATSAPSEAPTPAPAPAPAPPPEPVAPEIIVDRSTISIGADKVATGEPALGDRISALLAGKPAIEGHVVDMVAMRNAKPSQVAAVVAALRGARASSVNVKTEARDQTTQKLPVSFPSSLADCAVVAWIAKDAVIAVWPAGGGATKRVARGLAGPDMTLGIDAVRAQWGSCAAPVVVVGADEAMNWGLIFDLGTSALTAPGSRASSAVLVTTATPGKKVAAP